MPRIDLSNNLNLWTIYIFGIPFSVKLDEDGGIFVPRFRKKIPQTITGAGFRRERRLARHEDL